jgi:YjbR
VPREAVCGRGVPVRLNKRHWITVTLDGSLPDELVFGLLEDSYELIVDGLPAREHNLVRWRAIAEDTQGVSTDARLMSPTDEFFPPFAST